MYYYIICLFLIVFTGCSDKPENSTNNSNIQDVNNNIIKNATENGSIENDSNSNEVDSSVNVNKSTIRGKITNGYIKNSSICLDKNLNNICETSELKVNSDLEGNFVFSNIEIDDNTLVSFIGSGINVFRDQNITFSLSNVSLIEKSSIDKIIYITPISNIISTLFFKEETQTKIALDILENKIMTNLSLEKNDIYKNPFLSKKLFIKMNQIVQIQNIISGLGYSRSIILDLLSKEIRNKNLNINNIVRDISIKLSEPINIATVIYIQENLSKIYNEIQENSSNYESIRLEQLIKTEKLIEDLSDKIIQNIESNNIEYNMEIENIFNSRLSSLIGVNTNISDINILKNTINKEVVFQLNNQAKMVTTALSSNLTILEVEILNDILIINTKQDMIGSSIVTLIWNSDNLTIKTNFKVNVLDNHLISNDIEITLPSNYEGVVNHSVKITAGTTNSNLVKEYQWLENNIIISRNLEFDYIPKSSGKHTLTLRVIDNNLNIIEKSTYVEVKFILPLVVIMIEFNDYKFDSKEEVWHSKFFSDEGQSVKDYFNEVSYGKFIIKEAQENYNIDNDGIIKIKLNKNHPGNKGQNFKQNLQEAITMTDEHIDFSEYDINKNGHISIDELQIIFLVAGGESATGVSPGVWGHCSAFLNINAPIKDGVSLINSSFNGRYALFGEKHFVEDQHDATIGIIVHELGHSIFKLPDLYDTDQSSSGIGYFGLMAGGSWGRKSIDESHGETPVHMTGWSKIKANFIEPNYISEDVNQLELEETSFEKYKPYLMQITNNQYFLLENRNNSGYDRGLNVISEDTDTTFNGGLLILHVDENIVNNKDENHKMVDVEEASNIGLDDGLHKGHPNNLFFKENKTLFNSQTEPNSNRYDRIASDIELNNISEFGSTMSLNIKFNKE